MEWSKLKNIIILILLLLNLLLLVMLTAQKHGAAQQQEQALANTVSILERGGIDVDREIIPEELELPPLTVERDQTSEASMAASLLGEYGMSDLGGGRYSYQGALGSAEFRSNGTFSFSFEEGAQTAQTGREETHAVNMLEAAGITGTVTERREDGGLVTLTVRQTWQGLPVYSCRIILEYEGGCLRSMVGQRLMGAPQTDGSPGGMLDLPTALLRILNGINDLGDICNAITAMEPGYLLSSSAEGTRLIPAWYVTTDTGAYHLNAMTGVLARE